MPPVDSGGRRLLAHPHAKAPFGSSTVRKLTHRPSRSHRTAHANSRNVAGTPTTATAHPGSAQPNWDTHRQQTRRDTPVRVKASAAPFLGLGQGPLELLGSGQRQQHRQGEGDHARGDARRHSPSDVLHELHSAASFPFCAFTTVGDSLASLGLALAMAMPSTEK